jgi:hypothetical protein
MLSQQDRQYRVGAFFRGIQQSSRVIYWAAVADRPRLTPEWIDDVLEKNHGWLTSQTADRYDAEAFDFLPPNELQRLTAAVGRVRAVAAELGPKDSASADQRERAKPALKEILQLLEFDRYDDPEAFRLGKMIERRLASEWPPHLDHLRFRTGFDSTDDPALWVWAFVAQTGEYDPVPFLEWASDLRQLLDPVSREVAPEGRALVYFRSTAEQSELEGAAA